MELQPWFRRQPRLVLSLLLAPVVLVLSGFAGSRALKAHATVALQRNLEGRLGMLLIAEDLSVTERSRVDDFLTGNESGQPRRVVEMSHVTVQVQGLPEATLQARRILVRAWEDSIGVRIEGLRGDVTGSANTLVPRLLAMLDAAFKRPGEHLSLDFVELRIVVHEPFGAATTVTVEGEQTLQLGKGFETWNQIGEVRVTVSTPQGITGPTTVAHQVVARGGHQVRAGSGAHAHEILLPRDRCAAEVSALLGSLGIAPPLVGTAFDTCPN